MFFPVSQFFAIQEASLIKSEQLIEIDVIIYSTYLHLIKQFYYIYALFCCTCLHFLNKYVRGKSEQKFHCFTI